MQSGKVDILLNDVRKYTDACEVVRHAEKVWESSFPVRAAKLSGGVLCVLLFVFIVYAVFRNGESENLPFLGACVAGFAIFEFVLCAAVYFKGRLKAGRSPRFSASFKASELSTRESRDLLSALITSFEEGEIDASLFSAVLDTGFFFKVKDVLTRELAETLWDTDNDGGTIIYQDDPVHDMEYLRFLLASDLEACKKRVGGIFSPHLPVAAVTAAVAGFGIVIGFPLAGYIVSGVLGSVLFTHDRIKRKSFLPTPPFRSFSQMKRLLKESGFVRKHGKEPRRIYVESKTSQVFVTLLLALIWPLCAVFILILPLREYSVVFPCDSNETPGNDTAHTV